MKKDRKFKKLIRCIHILVVWAVLTLAWANFWMLNYAYDTVYPFSDMANWFIVGIYGALLLIFNRFYGGYSLGYYKRGNVIYSSILALIICNVITFLQASLIARTFIDIRTFLLMTTAQAVFIIVWTLAAHWFYVVCSSPYKLLMVYNGEKMADELHQKMAAYPESYVISDSIVVTEELTEAYNKMVHYDGVILCDMPAKQRNRLLKFCFEKNIRTYATPNISDILMRGAKDVTLFDAPLVHNPLGTLTTGQRFFKRLVDIAFTSIALLTALPFMLIIAIAIKLGDGGPVLYKQKRLTLGGKEFNLYKFRSMIVDAEKQTGAQLSTVKDPRITSVGQFLRALRLDELPQLINILNGDMSIVGPRPERPELAKLHQETMPEFSYRLMVKAGLTGLAQTVGYYNTAIYDKLRLDLAYIVSYSLLNDFKIMFMTVKVLFLKGSTKGVAVKRLPAVRIGGQENEADETTLATASSQSRV